MPIERKFSKREKGTHLDCTCSYGIGEKYTVPPTYALGTNCTCIMAHKRRPFRVGSLYVKRRGK